MCFIIEGNEIMPIVTTVAPTMPVDAASSMPTKVTENPRPPRRVPNSLPMVSSNSPATRDRSSMMPMNTNSGTATSTSLVSSIRPKMRLKTGCRNRSERNMSPERWVKNPS